MITSPDIRVSKSEKVFYQSVGEKRKTTKFQRLERTHPANLDLGGRLLTAAAKPKTTTAKT